MDQATFASWHDFYVTMGTASARLIGLLFVALSLNLDAITADSRDDLARKRSGASFCPRRQPLDWRRPGLDSCSASHRRCTGSSR